MNCPVWTGLLEFAQASLDNSPGQRGFGELHVDHEALGVKIPGMKDHRCCRRLSVTSGTLTLAANTPVQVAKTGSALTAGLYKVISKGSGGTVAGAVPAAVTVTGAGGLPTSLSIVHGELLLQVGTPETIYDDPRDLRVAAFIGSPAINRVAAEIGSDGVVRVGAVDMGLSSAARGPAILALRPEDLIPATTGLAATITHLEFLGESLLVHARLSHGGEAIVARLAPSERRGARIGDVITLAAAPGKGLLFGADRKRIDAAPVTRETVHG